MSEHQYDIVVVGAGIHGAGVAQAAAATGWSTLVLEKKSIAAGTSSKSSKLIHGGLRYLETAQISLVRECLRERQILLKIAPDLVHLVPFYIPIYEKTRRRPWQINVGLGLYQWLSGNAQQNSFRRIPQPQWQALEGISTDTLKAVFCYSDAQTNDVELTKAVLKSAQSLGAQLDCPALVHSISIGSDSSKVHVQNNQHRYTVNAKVVINASGPWVNQVLRSVVPTQVCMPVDLVQGAHIIVPNLVSKGIYYVEAPQDKRAVFVMPWQQHTLVGTTESEFTGNPDEVKPLETEIDYLLETCNYYFKHANFTRDDLIDVFAGLRVLPASHESAFKRSRDTVLWVDDETAPKLLTLYGGKLTAYRATAQRVIQRIQCRFPVIQKPIDTGSLMLT